MDLVLLVLVLAVIGFLVHVITKHIPMDPMFRLAIQMGTIYMTPSEKP